MRERWIAVVGSPRKRKNTELLVDYIIQGLKERNIEVDKFLLSSTNISTCSGCEYCMVTRKCKINDDISGIIDRMKELEVIQNFELIKKRYE
ncbi:flavodoxin family protein [Clostridium oryzae]|uniref:NADPH-dependent FMN reductase n=1 Tax=Clostridium oryzae TaxID=1450648 RepID=A0A1V4IDA9_9CLOT|nr:NAD(P)H-dependent oxidoreductase [Clostridium oryzae]OPJ57635.1 NADPH-dependent FMN reductase [Clostridium oryzae]